MPKPPKKEFAHADAARLIDLRLYPINRPWSIQRAVDFFMYSGYYEGYVLQHSPLSVHGWCDEKSQVIAIASNQPSAEKWRTLVHEISHIHTIGHGRDFLRQLRHMQRVWKEFNNHESRKSSQQA